MSICEYCGNEFDYNQSPAHTVCSRCYDEQVRSAYDEPVYIDSLGIPWTKQDLDDAGGIDEVNRLCAEARQ